MIDSIIYFDAASKVGTKLTALSDLKSTSLAKFVANTEQGDDFDLSSITPIKIITALATYDAKGDQLTPAIYAPGYGFLLATDDAAMVDALWNLPNNICRLQLDRESGKVLRNRITLAVLRTLQIEPLFAGSNYDFKTIGK